MNGTNYKSVNYPFVLSLSKYEQIIFEAPKVLAYGYGTLGPIAGGQSIEHP